MDSKKQQSRAPKSKRQAYREQRARKARTQRIIVIGGIVAFSVLFIGLLWYTNFQRNNAPVGEFISITPQAYTNADGLKIGNPNAKVVLDIFEDFTCIACKGYTQSIEAQVIRELVDTGLVYYVFHNYPFLDDSSNSFSFATKDSDNSAHAAMCAAEQNLFWVYHAMLYANSEETGGVFSENRLKAFAESVGLDTQKFNACLDDRPYQKEIDQDIALALQMGVTGTPSVFVNGQAVKPGFVPKFEDIKAAVDAVLAQE